MRNRIGSMIARFGKRVEDKPVELNQIVASAQRCLNNVEGEFFLQHLIDFYKLDDPGGALPLDEANYRNGTHDVVKYIVSLATDKETE